MKFPAPVASLLVALVLATGGPDASAQTRPIAPGDNLVVENIPAIPAELARKPGATTNSAAPGCKAGVRASGK